MRFRINGKNTLVAMGHKMFLLSPNQTPESVMVDNFGSLPMFDANQNHRYWLTNGRLWRNGLLGNELVGESLENQTLFWVGDKFGFGFYQSGEMSMHFTFDSNRSGINDSVKLPRIVGQLIDSSCVFSDNLCWFFTSVQYNGKRVNQCHVIKADGTVVGSASGTINDGSWLGNIRGNVAIGNFLLSATDDGIVKVQPNDTGQIEITQEFSDTEPYVSSADHLFLGNDGLTIVKPKEVWNIRII
jgi:H/ACA ribonucleoprotein complex subunit 3